MAYVKIKSISCSTSHMKAAIAYATNEEKAVLRSEQEQDAFDNLTRTQKYVLNDQKISLGDMWLATPIGVSAMQYAAEEFMATKRHWGKTDGRLAYQIIQSFAPDDRVTPELAHRIGCEFVRTLFPGYEAVVGTHLDRAHIHNHIIINSVSLETGRKAHFGRGYIDQVLREVSDRLCRENGLHIIERDNAKTRRLAQPPQTRHYAAGTLHEAMNRDIRWAARKASDTAGLIAILEDLGYEADLSGFHPKVRPPEGKRFFRLDTFYTEEELRIICLMPPKQPGGNRYRIRNGAARWTAGAQPLNQYTAMYLQMCILLGRQEADRKDFIPLSRYQGIRKMETQLHFIAKHGITKASDALKMRSELQAEVSELNRARYRLNGKKRRLQPVFDAQITVSCYDGRTDLSEAEQDSLRRAKAILSKSGMSAEEAREARTALEREILETGQKRREAYEELKQVTALLEDIPECARILECERREKKQKAAREAQEQEAARRSDTARGQDGTEHVPRKGAASIER